MHQKHPTLKVCIYKMKRLEWYDVVIHSTIQCIIGYSNTAAVAWASSHQYYNSFALCKEIHDSLGFRIPRHGFQIPGTGLQSLSLELDANR